MVIDFREQQDTNVPFLIVLIPLGKVAEVRAVQLSNARSPIVVTGKFITL